MAASAPKVSFIRRPKPTQAPDIQAKKGRIDAYLKEQEAKNTIILKEAFDRNVIFVGQTRAGKTTVFEVLKNPFKFVELGSIFSDTVAADIHHFTVEITHEESKLNYNIGIIDTPGLFEVYDVSCGKQARDAALLEDIILKCLNVEITKIHAIFFVLAYTGSVHENDIQSLERFLSLFKGADKNIHILITHAEGLDDARKATIKNELLRVPKLGQLLNATGEGGGDNFHFSGAVKQSYQAEGLVDVVERQLDNVLDMRLDLFETIFNADNPFDLNSIERAASLREKVVNDLREMMALLKSYQQLEQVPQADADRFKRRCEDLNSKRAVLQASDRQHAESFLKEAGELLEHIEADRLLEQLTQEIADPNRNKIAFKARCRRLEELGQRGRLRTEKASSDAEALLESCRSDWEG